MGLEQGNFISDLVITNPEGTDGINQADDHLRLIKRCIKNTFPNIDGVVNATDENINQLVDNNFDSTITELGVEVVKISGVTFTGEVYYTGPTENANNQLVTVDWVNNRLSTAYPAYPEIPKHVYGRISSGGAILKGSGDFTVTPVSTGIHDIVFNTSIAVPYVVVVSLASGSQVGYGSSIYVSQETSSKFRTQCNDDETGVATSRDYSFILTYYEA